MKVSKLERRFSFTLNGNTQSLRDPNPSMTPEEVMNFYSGSYAHLTTATIDGPEIKNDCMVYEFKTTVGNKG